MRYVKDLACIKCGLQYSPDSSCYLCSCGGLLEVRYDYDLLRLEWDRDSLAENSDFSMWRYLPLLPVGPFSKRSPLHIGWTPVYKSSALAKAIGLQRPVWVKDEGLNPTGSLKDRASAVAVVKAVEAAATTVACSSSGNAASSLAGNIAAMGGSMQAVTFVPARAPQGKIAQILIYGAKVISVQGSYREAFELSVATIERWGWYNGNAAINPYLIEGKKTAVLELAEQLNWQMPDWLVLPVGDGCTIAGAGKALRELKELGFIDKIPRLLGVQAAGCAPIYLAFSTGNELMPAEENTLADSIAAGVPRNPLKAIKEIQSSNGFMVAVEDEEILEALRLMGRTCGIFAEPSSAAGLAGLARAVRQGLLAADSEVALISTGNGLKDVASALKAASHPLRVLPDIHRLSAVVEEK